MRQLLVLALLCASACGDDDGGTDAAMPDTGTPDTGEDVGTDDVGPIDADVETTTVRLRYVDPDETPLADVKVQIEAAIGTARGTTGSDGVVELEVAAQIDDPVTVTAALEGFVILSAIDSPLPMAVTEDTPFDVTLFPVSVDPAPMLAINATGVPAGGRICASFDGWALCDDPPDTAWNYPVPLANRGDMVNIWLLDDTDTAIDFERVAVPDADTIDVTFDGSFDTAPTVRTVTIEIPADGGDLLTFDTDSQVRLWQGWFGLGDVDTNQLWSVATKLARDGDDLTVEFAEMTPPAEVTARYGARVFSNIQSFASSNVAVYVEDPGTTAPVMGLAMLTGDAIDQPYSITPPAMVGTEPQSFVVNFRNSARRFVWTVLTRSPDFTLPELPPDYDRTVTFPFEGASGTAIVRTVTQTEFGAMGPFDFDVHVSDSAPFPVTY